MPQTRQGFQQLLATTKKCPQTLLKPGANLVGKSALVKFALHLLAKFKNINIKTCMNKLIEKGGIWWKRKKNQRKQKRKQWWGENEGKGWDWSECRWKIINNYDVAMEQKVT